MFFGVNYLGAVYVPINISYRGGLLAHVIENSDATLIVAHAELVRRLADVDRAILDSARPETRLFRRDQGAWVSRSAVYMRVNEHRRSPRNAGIAEIDRFWMDTSEVRGRPETP